MVDQVHPLQNVEWNEAEPNVDLYRGIVALIAFDDQGKPQPVGSGFIIKSEGRRAWAVTAAHVLAGVRALQQGERPYSTALDMFLPRPRAIDIDRKRLRAMTRMNDRVDVLVVTGLAFDEKTDIGILTLAPQDDSEPSIPPYEFAPDDRIPSVGDEVCMLSFGGLDALDFKKDGEYQEFKLSLRPVLRIGRVLALHPDGTRLCRGPCIETSIPVFLGMSGGAIFHWNGGIGALKPFALVCSDPDPDDERKMDTRRAGASIMALLPVEVHPLPNGGQYTAIRFKTDDFSGDMDPGSFAPSFRPRGMVYLGRYSGWWNFRLPMTAVGTR